MKVHFHADYDHRWPSRAVTAFKAGWSGTVKRSVGEAAIGKGRATLISSDAKADANAISDDGRANDVGGVDPRSPSVQRSRRVRGQPGRDGDGAHPATPGTVNDGDAQ